MFGIGEVVEMMKQAQLDAKARYEKHHTALVTYLQVKVEAQDWHGVSDAANDLRVLEASQPALQPQVQADANSPAPR